MSQLHHINIRQLRHRIDEVANSQVTDEDIVTPDSGGTSSSGSPSADTPSDVNTVTVPIEQMQDEDGLFFPKTHTKAVVTNDNRRLNAVLDEMDSRLNTLEASAPNTSSVRIADNFMTDTKTVALSASRGKYLYDSIDQSADVKWDADKVTLRDAVVKSAHIADGAVEGDHIADEAIGANHLQDGIVTTDKVAIGAITHDRLSEEVQQTIDSLDTFNEWRSAVDDSLEDYDERITSLEEMYGMVKEQNEYLLTLHQKMKHSVLTMKFYNATLSAWDAIPEADYSPQQALDSTTTPTPASKNITLDTIRMTGLKLETKWHFYDEIDSKDYLPDSYSLKAVITSEGGEERTVVMSTNRGMNNITQEFTLIDLHIGDTVVLTSTAHYCWLNFPSTITLNIVE